MKILVFGQPLNVGGTQVNGIELAAHLRDEFGHEVIYFATRGPMLALVEEKALSYVPAPAALFRPSLARMVALYRLIVRERPDVLHVWDWDQCLDAYYVAHLFLGIPMVVTDMMMDLHRILPKSLPTTFGFPALYQKARASGRKNLELILPHVDVRANAPGVVDPQRFRDLHGVKPGEIVVVIVSRLASWMKADSIRRSIEALATLGSDLPLRLIVVGDGDARGELWSLASAANEKLGRPAVVFTGSINDPRPAYAAADIVIGMGSSALRGMAFAKPVIVVGTGGFCELFTPASAAGFYHGGLYGTGDGSPDNSRLTSILHSLANRPEDFPALGEFSRKFVLEHFSLELVGRRLEAYLRAAWAHPPRLHLAAWDGLRSAFVWVRERRFVPGLWRQIFSQWLDSFLNNFNKKHSFSG